MSSDESQFSERSARVRTLLRALTDGAVDCAVAHFADDAHLLRIRYEHGRVTGGERLASGKRAIAGWFSTLADRRAAVQATSITAKGDRLVVRVEWVIDGFNDERVRSSSLGVFDFAGLEMLRICFSSQDEDGPAG